jgi:hypothetical protein
VQGRPGVPVTISAVHHTFSEMDVSDLVLHLGILLECGLIRNAPQTTEKISNMYVIMPQALLYYTGISKKLLMVQ